MPKRPVETPITGQEIAFALLVLAGKLTDREAAEAVGISPGQPAYIKAKPRVREYMEQHRASVRAGLVQHEVDALAEFNIGREQILAKWWEFANIDPAKTGYNTTSQSKALDCLWDALGYKDDPDSEKPKDEELEPQHSIYRAKWMRKPGDPDYEEDEALDAELGTVNPALSSPEPLPLPPRPIAVPQTATIRASSNTMNSAVGPIEPDQNPGRNFGRFQAL